MITILVCIMIVSFFIGYYSSFGIKSQFVRLLDILVYGPILIILGFYLDTRAFIKIFLVLVGSTTISYNLKNYIGNSNRF
jgi:hypothetical protein